MVPNCAVKNCQNRANRKRRLSLHLFPKDPALLKKWLTAIGLKYFKPSDHTGVCSEHFRPEDFNVSQNSPTTLHKTAVPSIFSNGSYGSTTREKVQTVDRKEDMDTRIIDDRTSEDRDENTERIDNSSSREQLEICTIPSFTINLLNLESMNEDAIDTLSYINLDEDPQSIIITPTSSTSQIYNEDPTNPDNGMIDGDSEIITIITEPIPQSPVPSTSFRTFQSPQTEKPQSKKTLAYLRPKTSSVVRENRQIISLPETFFTQPENGPNTFMDVIHPIVVPVSEQSTILAGLEINRESPSVAKPQKKGDNHRWVNVPPYFGSFREENLDDPIQARRMWELAKTRIEKCRNTIKLLRTKNFRLEKRVSQLQALVEEHTKTKSSSNLTWDEEFGDE